MSLAALRDAIDLLVTRPLLWLPGAACGLLSALVILMAYYAGMFFAGRIAILFALVIVWLAAITYALVRTPGLTIGAAAKEGAVQYFRLLTPVLVVIFGIFLVFFLVVGTLALTGFSPDPSMLTFLTFGVMLPSVLLTFFADCAAVFEGKKVFEALARSIEVVTINLFETLFFYLGCFLITCVVGFACFIAWTAVLADKLEPVTRLNETQYATFTPQDLVALIGTEGIWVAAICAFVAGLILFPLLVTYKACFYRTFSGTTLPIQQVAGEYDSKGRWYKY
ncbi:MAG TPA: hypothetical protein P5217_08160 [Methanoregulaceae archaeon]|nr:hypothetical protein [Methanoregulaceae archaeon]HRY76241.1 hypothetical protein [Methanoregulaceae archaeon]